MTTSRQSIPPTLPPPFRPVRRQTCTFHLRGFASSSSRVSSDLPNPFPESQMGMGRPVPPRGRKQAAAPAVVGMMPSTLPAWAEHVSSNRLLPIPQEVLSDGTERRLPGETGPIEQESWELQTQTGGFDDDAREPEVNALKAAHKKQLAHYKTLLIRAQSASSSSLHELHSQLHTLQASHAALQKEHAQCVSERANIMKRQETAVVASAQPDKELRRMLACLAKDERMSLLGTIAEACQPSDIDAQIALLQKSKRSKLDILGQLDLILSARILTYLDVPDILNIRLVTRQYERITREAMLWKTLCRQVEWREGYGDSGLDHLTGIRDEARESIYKSLWRREQNWRRGRPRHLYTLHGHTNYVTSLKLRGDILISGSYDESIRFWNLSRLTAPPTVLPAKAVSCLDYYPLEEVFVVGTHDVGRVQVWRKSLEGTWTIKYTLAGHLHGIRAVAMNDKWLVSAGADKTLVVWDWRTGEKIIRFGQQTNICIGIQVIHDYILAVTVDGVLRTFSIQKRDMISQFKISDLARDDSVLNTALKDVGAGIGVNGMISWFEGHDRYMICATREKIIRLEWEQTTEEHEPFSTLDGPQCPSSFTRIRTTSSAARALPPSPKPKTPVRQRMVSPPTACSLPISPQSEPKRSNKSSHPVGIRHESNHLPSPTRTASTASRKSCPPLRPSSRPSISGGPSVPKDSPRLIVPVLTKPPKVIEVIPAADVERGAVDTRRMRAVISTRFAARQGAARQLLVSDFSSEGPTRVTPITGAWTDNAARMDLQTPEKNPMSLVMDRNKLVYGCTDGTIVVVAFDEPT